MNRNDKIKKLIDKYAKISKSFYLVHVHASDVIEDLESLLEPDCEHNHICKIKYCMECGELIQHVKRESNVPTDEK